MGINFQNVDFKYAPLACKTLKNVNLKIDAKDEFIFILGHTGSGKSTLVQLINALLLPSMGQVTVFGKNVVKNVKRPIVLNTSKNKIKFNLGDNSKLFAKGYRLVYSKNLKELRKHIGLVFQFPEYQLFESSVIRDVVFGPKNYGIPEEEAYKLARRALSLVGIPESLYEESPFSTSGGQKRRIAIAGILAINPDVLIFDEPTVGLDPKGKDDLMNLLTKIQNETHKTIIMISHDMDIVANYAKRVIVLNQGEIKYDGKSRELFENEEILLKYNLDLSTPAYIAKSLKEKGLIKYSHLPITLDELEKVILGGDIYE